ncbi:MAG TPA: cytochrome c, partial [Acidimicrobiia bacterium]|nr:cytochrome c [Acidimicrobiia bacterium]
YYWISTGRMPIRNDNERIGRRPSPYTPDMVTRLMDYVASIGASGGPDIPRVGPGNLADGLHLFALECASCHAWSGRGSIIYKGKVPTVTPANPEQVASAIRIGPGEMPAFGQAAIDQQQLNDVVAYVQTLKHPKDSGGLPLFHRGPTTEGGAALFVGLGSLLLAIGWIGTKAKLHAR